ncbi:MAG: hypothetical protein FJ009_21805 [Chloroflexi bacterium]|nr:hypothetical protein [Chloroflexota bacterium]
MAKTKETKTTYSAEPITVVTARGTTEIPRALRERYRVTAKSRLRWTDTGNGLLVVPESSVARIGKHQVANPMPTYKPTRQSKREFLAWLDEWMKEPDDWTPEQWDEFEKELRANRVRFRDIEI